MDGYGGVKIGVEIDSYVLDGMREIVDVFVFKEE